MITGLPLEATLPGHALAVGDRPSLLELAVEALRPHARVRKGTLVVEEQDRARVGFEDDGDLGRSSLEQVLAGDIDSAPPR